MEARLDPEKVREAMERIRNAQTGQVHAVIGNKLEPVGEVLLGGFHGVWGGWRPLEPAASRPAASRLLTEGAK